MVVVSGLIDPLDDGSAVADAVRGVVPIDIVGIKPQADAGEGVCLQVEVTHGEGLGNGRCGVVSTVTCLVGGDCG